MKNDELILPRANNKDTMFSKIFVFMLCAEIILYILNDDVFFQMSGFYLPMLFVLMCGIHGFLRARCGSFQVILLSMLGIFAINTVINFEKIQRGYLLSILIGIVFLFELSYIKLSAKQIDRLKYAYMISSVLISSFIIVFRERYYELDPSRLTIKIGSNPAIDPNYLAAFLTVPFLLILDALIVKKKGKLLYALSLLIVGAGIFMTGSRGAYLGIVLGSVILLFMRKMLTPKRIVNLIIPAITLAVVALFILPSETVDRFINIGAWFSDASNLKRFALWENALNVLVKNPFMALVGYGARSSSEISGEVLGKFNPSHNTYLDFALQQGIIFLLLLFSVMGKIVFGKGEKMAKCICITTFVVNFFIGSVATFAFWWNIGLALIMLRGDQEENV